MKNCELGKCPARMFCESDRASLCWDCDTKVHNANFIVARHFRYLLCQKCQSLTPCNADGPKLKLGRIVSVYKNCVGGGEEAENEDVESEIDDEESADDRDDVYEGHEEGEEKERKGASPGRSKGGQLEKEEEGRAF